MYWLLLPHGSGSWPASARWFVFMRFQSDGSWAVSGQFLEGFLTHMVEVTQIKSAGWCWLVVWTSLGPVSWDTYKWPLCGPDLLRVWQLAFEAEQLKRELGRCCISLDNLASHCVTSKLIFIIGSIQLVGKGRKIRLHFLMGAAPDYFKSTDHGSSRSGELPEMPLSIAAVVDLM